MTKLDETDSRVATPSGRPESDRASRGRWPLVWQLLVPLMLLAVLFCGTLSFLLIRTVSSRMDRSADARLTELAQALVTSGFALDRELLGRVQAVTAAELTVLSPDGAVVVSTLPDALAAELESQLGDRATIGFATVEGSRYRVLARDLDQAGGVELRLVVAASTEATDQLKRRLALTIVLTSGVALIVTIVIGLAMVKRTTRPLARLAAAAREVGRGELGCRVPGGGAREIETVAAEFNAMLGELDRSREELVRAEKLAAAGSMAAGVAHEIRNPLSAIRMNLQLMDRKTEASDLREEFGELLDEIDRLDLVVANLLDLAAPSRLAPEVQQLNPVLEGALRLTRRKLEHLGVQARCALSDDLPPVKLDPNKARQAFLNVILNAAEAMPEGGRLRVATHRAEDGNVEVSFTDSGAGMTGEAAARVFAPFFTTKTGGAGLGLHKVRNIMELHGGRVRFEPASPRGTRCILEFPSAGHRAAESAQRRPA
jgi:signal transduction histidine kinase